jgi:hypothetical protein
MAKTPVLAFKFGEVGKGLLSHFPIESPRLESPRTRIINPYAGSPFNISMRYIHSAILNPNFLSQEEAVTLNSFPIPSAAQTRAGPLQQSFSFDSLAAPPHGFVSSGDSNGANHHRFRRVQRSCDNIEEMMHPIAEVDVRRAAISSEARPTMRRSQ